MSTVSVIIPVYNRESVIPRALRSVLDQDYKPIEVIVVDDGSNDKTSQIIRSFPQVKTLCLQENRGVSYARNRGVEMATGEWIAFLDSDDEWKPDKLSALLEYAKKSGDFIVHSDEIWIRNGLRVNPKNKHQKFGGFIFDKCLDLCRISPSAVLLKKTLFEEMGGFDEEFPVCEDYDLWLKITSRYRVGFVDRSLIIKYGGHSDQLSRRFKAMDYWRVRSLERILMIRSFCAKHRQKVIDEMLVKACILEKGMKKHNNLQHLPYVQGIIKHYSQEYPNFPLCHDKYLD